MVACSLSKLQALVYAILPSITAITDYAICFEKTEFRSCVKVEVAVLGLPS